MKQYYQIYFHVYYRGCSFEWKWKKWLAKQREVIGFENLLEKKIQMIR
jgi:hypothetical protein